MSLRQLRVFAVLFFLCSLPAFAATAGTALVRRAPLINGTIDGSVQQMTGESAVLNGGSTVSGDWLVPGTPAVRQNGKPTFGGVIDGSGSTQPSSYQITLNGNSSLRHVVRRTDPLSIPVVKAPPLPSGTRWVVVNSRGDSVGSYSTVRSLTLNGNVGQFAVPPGTYGDFTANGGAGFTLGVAGSTQPVAYNFQRLTLNGQAQLQIVGPVVITVANAVMVNGAVGATARPEWTTFNVYSGGFTVNGGCSVYGYVTAPTGTVIVNGASQLVGGVAADQLIVNGGGALRLVQAGSLNHVPVANDVAIQLDEDTPATIQASASDADGDPLSYTTVSSAAHGTLVATGAGTWTYTPAANFNGNDSFTYKANDGKADSNTATVSIVVRPINDGPTATPRAVTLDEDSAAAVLLAGDDVDGDALTFTVASPPANGVLSGTAPTLTYTPNPDFFGSDSFTFTASDGRLTSSPAVVQITVTPVNDAPVALSREYTVTEGSTLSIVLTGTDVDSPASSLTYQKLGDPAKGTLTGTAPSFVYAPPRNSNETVSFTFTVSDGQLVSAPGTITIHVVDRNFPPVARDDSAQTDEDTPVSGQFAASDDDGDPLTFSLVAAAAHGSVTITGAKWTYAPAKDWNGIDSFTFKASDGKADSNVGVVTVTVRAVNDAPVAAEQKVEATEDTPVTITLSASDVDGAISTWSVVSSPKHGRLGPVVPGAGNTATLLYTPDADFNGADDFSFKVNDGSVDSLPAAVSIVVKAVNDAPVAQAQEAKTLEDTPLDLTLAATDVDSPSVTIAIATPPQHGAIVLVNAGALQSTWRYTPEANYHGQDTFTFVATDGDKTSEPALVGVTIEAVNDAPVADGGPALVYPQDTPIAFTLGASDVDGDQLTYAIVTQPQHGTLSGTAPNLTYTPNFNYRGDDALVYRANDGALNSNDATVVFRMTPVSHAPTATGSAVTLAEDTDTPITLAAADLDGDILTYLIVTPPKNGTLTQVSPTSPTVTYHPARDYNGADAFVFKVYDGGLYSGEASVALTVTAVNDAPVAAAASVATDEDVPLAIVLSATDAETDPLSYTIVTAPQHGTLGALSPRAEGGVTVVYTPAKDYNGTDGFTFKATDGKADSAAASVSIAIRPINDPPTANGQTVEVESGQSVSITLTGVDPDGDPLAFAVATPPAHGTLSGSLPSLVYASAAGFVGNDSFTFTANDGTITSVPATISIKVTPPNSAPVVEAGTDMAIPFVPNIGGQPAGRIVVNNDEWALTDDGYAASPYAGAFGRNLADYLVGGKPGAKFLAYTNVISGSVDFIYTGAKLAATMQAAGYSWTTSSTIQMTLANLKQYDAVYLGANVVDNQVLIDYVEQGGSVYLSSGTHWCGCDSDKEAALWNPFLNHFGLKYAPTYNGINGTLPVESDNGLFYGIHALLFGNGNSVSVLNPDNPFTTIALSYNGQGLIGVYGAQVNQVILRGTATDDGNPNPPGALTYQWTQVTGPAPATLDAPTSATSRVRFSSSGKYVFRITASDGGKSASDEVAIVVNSPPAVYAGPDAAVRSVSDAVTITGTVTDDNVPHPPIMAWKQLSGPATAMLATSGAPQTAVTFTAAGLYTFELSADDGMNVSRDTVDVRVASAPIKPAADMVAWWPLNYSRYDVVSGNRGLVLNDTAYAPGFVGGALSYNGSTSSAYVPGHKDLDIGASPQGLTIEFWARWDRATDAPLFAWHDGAKDTVRAWTQYSGTQVLVTLRGTDGQDRELRGPQSLAIGQWTHLAVTYDKDSGTGRLYYNGYLVLEKDLGVFTPETGSGYPLWVGSRPDNRQLLGAIDEFTLYRRPLLMSEIRAIAAAGADGKCPPDDNLPPTVNAGPDIVLRTTADLATLAGIVLDDGKPYGVVTQLWSVVGGPSGGTVEFGDATKPSTTAKFSAPGTYVLRLTASDGYSAAVSDLLEVRVGVAIPEPAASVAAWWPGNGDGREVLHGNHDLELGNGTAFGPGKVGPAFTFDGVSSFARVQGHPDFDIGASPTGLTIEFWARWDQTADVPLFAWMGAYGLGSGVRASTQYSGTQVAVWLRGTDGVDRELRGPQTLTVGQWQRIAVTYDKVSGIGRLYYNNLLVDERSLGVFTPDTVPSRTLWVGSQWNSWTFKGAIDEFTLYSRPLTYTELLAVYAAGADGKSPPDNNLPPVVDAGPDLVLGSTGAVATLNGVVTDDGRPLGSPVVQWTTVAGPGEAVFTDRNSATTTVQFPVSGTYLLKLIATDGLSAPVFDFAEVRVNSATIEPASGLVAWWSGNGHGREIVSGRANAELVNGATIVPGKVLQAFGFDGVDDQARVNAHADIDLGTSDAGFTVEFWMNPTELRDAMMLSWGESGTPGLEISEGWYGREVLVDFRDRTDRSSRSMRSGAALTAGQWSHVAITHDRATGEGRIYIDGVLKATSAVGTAAVATQYGLMFGRATSSTGSFWKGSLDEVSFYSRPLSATEIQAIFAAGIDGKCPPDDNLPPQVDAGPNLVLSGAPGSVALNGTVMDDGKPVGVSLTTRWSVVEGPTDGAALSDATSAKTSVTFSKPGTYLLKLAASDGLAPVSDVTEVRVGAACVSVPTGLTAWWTANGHTREVVNGRANAELYNGAMLASGKILQGFSFDGVDDHARVNAHPDVDLGTSDAGFTIEFWINPAELRDATVLSWGKSGTPGLEISEGWWGREVLVDFRSRTDGASRSMRSGAVLTAGQWSHVAVTHDRATGEGRIYVDGTLKATSTVGTTAVATQYGLMFGCAASSTGSFWKGNLDEVSFYNRPLSATEIQALFAAGADGKLPSFNERPVVSVGAPASAYVNAPVSFSATAVDDGLPNPPAALTYAWSKVSGPGNVAFSAAGALATTATFDAPGTYLVRFSASDSVLTGTADAAVVVTVPPSQPPNISFYEPANGAKLAVNRAFDLAVHASDPDGTIASVTFYQGTTKLGQQTLPAADDPTTYFWRFASGLPAGSYTFSAVATDNTGVSTTSGALSITVIADPGDPNAEIVTPADSGRISAPTDIKGVVATPLLAAWKLQYRLNAAEGQAADTWISIASGTAPVGTPAQNGQPATAGTLGTFDPTRLLNGIYEVQLTATDTVGRTVTDALTLVVEGNMKVGVFSLAFEDLKLPVAGIPITITRTYDSRDTRVGDFGPGWRLALANVRVQKNRHLGNGWWQTPQSGDGIQFYDVLPLDERVVTVTMPDGETHRFRAGAYVKNRDGDPDYRSFATVVRQGLYKFYALGDTTSKLEPLDSANQLYDHFWIEGTGNQALNAGDYGDITSPVFNATRFRLTTKDGLVLILDEALGLLEMRDLNGNTLVVNRDASNRVTSVVSTLGTGSSAVVSTITIHRDATGRVDYIRDPAKNDLDYLYDEKGRLSSFTNRENNSTQFKYQNAAFPYYLTDVIDPRGITALRSEYDASGKLIKQIDAAGKETVFNHGADTTGRFEKITDRLGKVTTFYYDDRGNVTAKIDPLGAQTSYTYYPDSDRVRFETDHYGNVKGLAYDDRGNPTVETVGASIADDPASPTTGYTTRTTYNALGSPTQVTDPDGRVQAFAYEDVTNALQTHTVGSGGTQPAVTTYKYYADGTLKSVTDAVGNVTTHVYNYTFTDAAYPGAVKEVTVTVTDPAGSAGSDTANTTDAVLRKTRTLFDGQENQLAEIVTRHLPDGTAQDVVTRNVYDTENRLRATLLPDGRVSETRYNAFGKTSASVQWQSVADYTAAVDAKARITSYGYDSRGNQTSVTYPDGTSEQQSFDAENRKTWSQDRRGYRTFYTYDAVGRLRFTIFPDDNDGVGAAAPIDLTDTRLADNPRTETQYDLIGRVTHTYDETGAHTENIYFADSTPDALRRKQVKRHYTVASKPATQVTGYQYDKAGNVRYVTDPRGNTVETQYDDHGRPTTVVYPATDEHPSTTTETRYDALGRRTAVVDQEGKVTRYRYDGLGRLAEVRQYIDATLAAGDADFHLAATTKDVAVTRYTYDELGNQQTQTDALGRATTFWTDTAGRRTKRVLPKDTTEAAALSETLQYDGWGNLWKRTDFAGKTTVFGYDALNRLTSKTADATHPSLSYSHAIARIEYEYDENGARKAARTYNAANTALYGETTPRDVRGRIDYKDTAGGRLDYSYYANGQLKDVVSSNTNGVNVGYRYDGLNRLEHVDDATTGTTQTSAYTYTPNGSLETLTQPNGVVHAYGYDSLNRLRTLAVSSGATQLHGYEHKLYASGHRHQVVEGTKTTTYTYDGLYRLTDETVTGAAAGQTGAIGYDLDKVGNRLARNSALAAVGTQLNQTYNARDWRDGDSYNANGSTTSGALATVALTSGTFTDTYDFEERLILRTKADGTSINVNYDADGVRVSKQLLGVGGTSQSSTYWLIDANNLTGYAQVVEERISTAGATPTTTTRTYTYGTALLARTETVSSDPTKVAICTFAADGHGSIRELTDATGKVTDAYTYEAFGNLVFKSGTTSNNYLYCGEQFDPDLGLYYLRARYLNSDSGRFWSMDSYEGRGQDPVSLHKYLYASANPVTFRDPSGRLSLGETAMVGATVGILAKLAIVSYKAATGQNYTSGQILKELAEGAGYGALGAVVAFYTNPIILRIGETTGWYGVFGAGTASGTASAGSVALFKEFVDFYLLHKPTTFQDAEGRVINATVGGFMTGGIFTIIRYVPKAGPSVPKEVGFDPVSGEAYVFTPYGNLGPAYFKEVNDAANLGATPRTMSASVIQKIINKGITLVDDHTDEKK